MKIKELQKTVNIAWSPLPQNPIYLAAGTAAQQFDSNINSSLEIYSTNFSDPGYDLELKASLPSQYRFQKVIWSPTGLDTTHRNGLIVGGCEGGHVMIYSAAKMLANEEGLIARQDKHTGPVTGLDVNPFQTNLLASCASESEIFIWDLNNTSTHMNPGTKTQPLEDVQNVAWNRQVQHILASVFSCRCVIWDLRKSEQIIKLSDTQSRVRWHAIQWHPEVATQVWLASEDDQAPVVQMWDLRYATSPAKTMQIHQRGVLGMSWCPRDSDLVVSCGKDNRIYCWNSSTEKAEGEILSEVATTSTWYSDVQWCPRNPALIASSSLDGNVSIYSLFGGTQQQVETSNKIADSFPGMDQFAQAPASQQSSHTVYHDLKRAPKWIKRPCGVTFGFGGKLVSFNGKSKSVNISQVITEPSLVKRANDLEQSLGDANYAEYCRQRADQMPDQNGRYLWYFIKANFELNPKEEMLNLLGYNKDDIDSKFSKYVQDGPIEQEQQGDVNDVTNRLAQLNHSDSSEVECDQSTTDGSIDMQPSDNTSLFDGIATAQKELSAAQAKADKQFTIPSGDHPDSVVAEALLTGNLEAAVELCMEANRPSEALIIASTAGIEFLTKVQNRYLRQQDSELARIIAALVSRDWINFINHCTVESWKEALVAILKHSDRKLVDICERLGDRLLSERSTSTDYIRNAMLCYVCAGSIDKLVAAFYQLKQLEQHSKANYKLSTDELQELAELVMLMSKSLEQQGIALELGNKFSEFISEYGGLLASQGALTAALSYILALGSSSNTTLDELRERLYNTVNYKQQPQQSQQQQFQQQQQQQAMSNPARGAFVVPQSQPQPQVQPQANVYSRQQQQRGSFSQQQPLGFTSPQVPAANPLPTQYQANTWNAPPTPAAATTIFNPALPAAGPAPAPPTAATSVPKPPQAAVPEQPPRPTSAASSQGGSSSGGGLLSRSKYVLDPSVAAPTAPSGYGAPYNPAPMSTAFNPNPVNTLPQPAVPAPGQFNTTPFNTNPMAPTTMQGNLMATYNPAAPYAAAGPNPYMPVETAAQPAPPPPLQNIQRNPTPPPGWNDPPALKSTRTAAVNRQNQSNVMSAKHAGIRQWQKIIGHEKEALEPTPCTGPHSFSSSSSSTTTTSNASRELGPHSFNNAFSPGYAQLLLQDTFLYQQAKKSEAMPAAPITHPIFGVDPNQNLNQNQNGYLDPNAQYQNAPMSGMPGMPGPPPPTGTAYYNPNANSTANVPPNQNNNMMPSQPQQMNFQTQAIPPQQLQLQQQPQQQQQQQQQQLWNNHSSAGGMGYTEQAAPIQRQAEPPKEKPPLPEEYIYLQTVLEELKTQCLAAANDPRTKRKFVDVAKRLENLYDCLRDGRLTPATIGALNQIVQSIQVGDYGNAMQTQTQIAFGSDFSQCAGFMPGLKVLVQSASDLQVYLR